MQQTGPGAGERDEGTRSVEGKHTLDNHNSEIWRLHGGQMLRA